MSWAAPAPLPVAFTLDAESTSEITRIAGETGVPPDQLMGMALRMLIIAVDARKSRRKVLLTSQSGYPIKEIFIPEHV